MPKKITLLFLFSFFLPFFSLGNPDSTGAENALILSDTSSMDFYSILPFSKYFVDSLGDRSFEEISSAKFAGFKECPFKMQDNFPVSEIKEKGKAIWLRFNVINNMMKYSEWVMWVGFGNGTSGELFELDSGNNFIFRKSGMSLPLNERDVKYGNTSSIRIILPPRSQKLFFLKTNQDTSSLQQNSIRQWWMTTSIRSNESFNMDDRNTLIFQSFCLGIMLIMAIYNLILFFTLKDYGHLFYSLFILTFGLFFFVSSGYGFEFFWPQFPQLDDYLTMPLLGFSLLFYSFFGKYFLQIKNCSPKWNKIINGQTIGVFAISFLLCLFLLNVIKPGITTGRIVAVIAILLFVSTFITLLVPAVIQYKRKYIPATYFLFANVLLIVSIFYTVVSIFFEIDFLQNDSMELGAVMQTVVFSLGLANRIKVLGIEKEKARENALIFLEQKVLERTQEVTEKSNKLSKAYHNIEEKNKDILASITYAQRIQEAILPPPKIVKQYLKESFIYYKPKDIVAGDFYWMEVAGDCILFAACDCTGHGVPGAFMSIVGNNALNKAVKEYGLTEPAKILNKVNEIVDDAFSRSETGIKDGMDLALCKLTLENQASLEFAGANNPLYLIRNGTLKEIKADKQPIGKFTSRKPFTNHVIPLMKGDSFYIFTDGYSDQFGGPKGKKFKYSQFENLLISISGKAMDEQRKILDFNFENWKGVLEQVDDICVIGVKI